MNTNDIKQLNETFLLNLENGASLNKQAAAAGGYIRDKVKEASVLDRLLKPETIKASQAQRSAFHDQPVVLVDIEPDAQASIINFKSGPEAKYLDGKRMEVPFFKIATDKLQKNEIEIATYPYPITDVIEKNMVKEIAYVKDERFFEEADSVISDMGANSTATYAANISRDAIATGANLLADYEMEVGTIVMSKKDFNIWSASSPSDIGDGLAGEMAVKGYAHGTIGGYNIIVTNKQDAVAPGTVYFFAPAEFLGKNYQLADVKFEIKKDADLISMQGWGYYACAIVNVRAVVSVTVNTGL